MENANTKLYLAVNNFFYKDKSVERTPQIHRLHVELQLLLLLFY